MVAKNAWFFWPTQELHYSREILIVTGVCFITGELLSDSRPLNFTATQWKLNMKRTPFSLTAHIYHLLLTFWTLQYYLLLLSYSVNGKMRRLIEMLDCVLQLRSICCDHLMDNKDRNETRWGWCWVFCYYFLLFWVCFEVS